MPSRLASSHLMITPRTSSAHLHPHIWASPHQLSHMPLPWPHLHTCVIESNSAAAHSPRETCIIIIPASSNLYHHTCIIFTLALLYPVLPPISPHLHQHQHLLISPYLYHHISSSLVGCTSNHHHTCINTSVSSSHLHHHTHLIIAASSNLYHHTWIIFTLASFYSYHYHKCIITPTSSDWHQHSLTTHLDYCTCVTITPATSHLHYHTCVVIRLVISHLISLLYHHHLSSSLCFHTCHLHYSCITTMPSHCIITIPVSLSHLYNEHICITTSVSSARLDYNSCIITSISPHQCHEHTCIITLTSLYLSLWSHLYHHSCLITSASPHLHHHHICITIPTTHLHHTASSHTIIPGEYHTCMPKTVPSHLTHRTYIITRPPSSPHLQCDTWSILPASPSLQ